MFIEIACDSQRQTSPLLYLPIRKTQNYFKHFPGTSKKRQLYVRIMKFSNSLQNLLKPLFDKMQSLGYVFMIPGNESVLDEIDFDKLKTLIFQCTDHHHLQKWIRLVKKSKKQWEENHPVFGKCLLLCAFFLAHAFSEYDLKKQFRLLKVEKKSI
jgi:hypothetical protein